MLPALDGNPVEISFAPELKAYRGRLLSGNSHPGVPVHAAAFVRARRIVLEDRLLRKPRQLRWMLLHEAFHLVWVRLGNERRHSFAAVLEREMAGGCRGELGESAEVRKAALAGRTQGSAWKEYVCESFCDTAAWFCCGEMTEPGRRFAERWKEARRSWFRELCSAPLRC